ncbi:hypothetical protein TREAZ_0397 [Leadbettera azotonutricia ZAS-9]|uniref:Uncharacterized protein n=1 Tax=Leadbettera azotonutricia (strain ATCC BAA-888 / DSM 13862 / ZAS-9) TaxID=545695 RepID=F5YCX5_LEAAZ|nr:hypothetical protein TREAZ_0397 [Leadbettera azotonutricia ZAS-9]
MGRYKWYVPESNTFKEQPYPDRSAGLADFGFSGSPSSSHF